MGSISFKLIKNVIYILVSLYLMFYLSKDGRAQNFTQSNSTLINTNVTDAWNIAWVDINGDGFDDIFLTEYGTNDLNHVYLNDGNGDFYEDFSTGALTEKVAGSISSTWADIDNDGDRDVHVSNFTGGPNFLITNNADGTFSDNSVDMNLAAVGYYHGSTWADYDNDGYVDLFTACFQPTKYSELYHNNGDGTFTQVLNSPVAYHTGRSIGATWADYDGDGWMDLFIPNGNNQNNALFHNVGNGTFQPVLSGDIVNDAGNSVASCWGDIDNDGDLDLFVSNTSEHDNFLYFNNGDGTFFKETNDVVASDGGQTHGCNFIDVDNDGDLDLYTCNTQGQPNKLYLNDGTGAFTVGNDPVLSDSTGIPYGQAWSDFDKDGDMDLFISTNGGDLDKLFINNTTGNNWLNLKVKGSNSNFSAIGATISLLADGVWQMRQVNSQSGFGSQNSLFQHFGIGTATNIDSIKIKWPSGYTQLLINVAPNQFLNVEEDDAAMISGVVYDDANGNCHYDEGESTISGARLRIQPGDILTATNENGVYCVKLPLGEYEVGSENPAFWTHNCADELAVSVEQIGEAITGIDFAKVPEDAGADLWIQFSAAAQRRGFTNMSMISFGNHGTLPDYNRWIELKMPDGVYLTDASIPWDQQIGNIYLWQFDTIPPGFGGSIELTDSVGLELSVGDSVLFHANITTFQDLDNSNDMFNLVEPIVGAIDPNDIQVSPKGFGKEGFVSKTDTLSYRIRFQNVGTYYAQNVYITDSLPEQLDPNTVQVESMSHKGNWWIEDNIIHWKFLNINLPDSNRNEPESHGYVIFSVAPYEDVDPGVEIENDASIEFDFEAPLLTNTTLNTIKYLSAEEHNTLEIFPNPMSSTSTFRLARNREMFDDNVAIASYRVFDYTGKPVKSVQGLNDYQITVDRTGLSSGTYIILAKDELGAEHHGRIVIVNREQL